MGVDSFIIWTNKVLLTYLQPQKNERNETLPCRLGLDDTNTQLTVDFYTAHFRLQHSFINLSTVNLLDLTDLLWDKSLKDKEEYKDAVSSGRKVISIDDAIRDPVCQLVKDILPVDKLVGGNVPEKWKSNENGRERTWAEGHGEHHNFFMRSRFMEFAQPHNSMDDPCFCDDTYAAIPRRLAREHQKKIQASGL